MRESRYNKTVYVLSEHFKEHMQRVIWRLDQLTEFITKGDEGMTATITDLNNALNGIDSTLATLGTAVAKLDTDAAALATAVADLVQRVNAAAPDLTDETNHIASQAATLGTLAANINTALQSVDAAETQAAPAPAAAPTA
jgi:prefoldin subunit 5